MNIVTQTTSKQDTITNRKHNTDKEEISFTFFDTDGGRVNAGLGFDIDPTDIFDNPAPPESDESVEPVESFAPPESEPEPQPEPVESVNDDTSEPIEEPEQIPEPDQVEDIVEKSARLFAETRASMNSRPINPDIDNLEIAKPNTGSLQIEEAEAAPLSIIQDLEDLEQSYQEQTIPIKEKIVEVDKVTTADRAGKAIKWLTQTFIVSPVSSLARFIGIVFLILLGSGIATIFYNVHKTGLPINEVALQFYGEVKTSVVALYKDIIESFKGSQ